jgi:chemotaxis protein MotB
VNHERWLVSYADFITLLFAFFVVLYSAAQVDKKKVTQVAEAIQAAFEQLGAFPDTAVAVRVESQPPEPLKEAAIPAVRAPGNGELANLRKELEQALAPEIARGEVAVRSEPEGLVISLREVGFFDSGSSGIKARSQPALSRMASLLTERKYYVRIEGHTDNVPIHNTNFTSNWELSTARATEMVRLLITQHQFPAGRLSAAGYAEYHPIASNDSAEGRAKNRRVDVVILGRPQTAAGLPTESPSARNSEKSLN